MAKTVELKKIVEKMNLKNLTPDVELNDKKVEVPDINRPALQLTGFFEHFDSERVQIIGYVEYTFLEKMDEEKKREVYKTLLSYKIPCIIFCRNLSPEQMLLDMAVEADVPIFITEKKTSAFTAEIIRWLNVQLAPCISIHGVLVDVYGVGVLIMGGKRHRKERGCAGACETWTPSGQRRRGRDPQGQRRDAGRIRAGYYQTFY